MSDKDRNIWCEQCDEQKTKGHDCTSPGSACSMPSLDEMVKVCTDMKNKFESSQAFHNAGFNFHSMCDPCKTCGHVRRVEGRTVFVCEHFYSELKRHARSDEELEASPRTIIDPSVVMGMIIEIESA